MKHKFYGNGKTNFIMFPPVNSGGLIEARGSWRVSTRFKCKFPPVNSGGLIEAGKKKVA